MPLNFVDRHNGPREAEQKEMLKALGCSSLDELISQTVPQDIMLKEPLALDKAVSEYEYIAALKKTAALNKNFRSLIGMGFYGTASPAVIMRNIFENPSWYTSYTPYQAEISQGRLEALVNFQTMIASLTGFNLANCSMLDDATAAAEAMRMMFELRSRDAVKAGKNVVFVDEKIFPQVLSVLKTRAGGLGIEIRLGDWKKYEFEEKCYGAILQYPAADGEVCDYSAFCAKAHAAGALVAAECDLLALAILKEPAAWGCDIVCGSAQRFGLPMGFGGPVAGFMACSDQYKRNLPGRIIGISVDRLGNKGYRLALQTREQHIKRERATSNICTATALLASMTGMFAVWHGPKGITEIAMNAYGYAHAFAGKLKEAGYKLSNENFFDTIEIVGADVEKIRAKALAAGFNFFYTADGKIRISFDELSNCAEAKALGEVFGCKEGCPAKPEGPVFMKRETPILTQKVFNTYHSETEMMRYIKKLERKDVSLT
ncbi:MAG: glycine dehydrogenase (aminomethyl-transferring), partial [Bacteroidales bacterium]|nr:glycine dehydrogenase (aminomethyl-transferring) [Bacteroidales bacterium]